MMRLLNHGGICSAGLKGGFQVALAFNTDIIVMAFVVEHDCVVNFISVILVLAQKML